MTTENRAIKVRLYPNKEQMDYFDNVFGCCRFVWNQMLGDMMRFYKETDITFIPTPAKYKSEYKFLRDIDSLALADTRLDLVAAFKKFCSEKRIGFPKFKSKKTAKRTFTTNNQENGRNPTVRVASDGLHIPKLKSAIKVKMHRSIPAGWKLKAVTISQTATGKYFAALLFAYEVDAVVLVEPTVGTTLGLDYSSPHFYVDSNNCVPNTPHSYRKTQKRLAHAQRMLSKKHRMSKNYQKQKAKVATVHEKVANQRKDFCHKQSTAIAKQYSAVCVEDINLRGMAGSLRLGKSTNDNGFGMFREMLRYKLASQGKQLITIDKWYPSSKTCHECGGYNKGLTLKDKDTWICPHCGCVVPRDYNAALNIRDEGLRTYYKEKAFAAFTAA